MALTVKQLAERLLPLSPNGDLDGLVRQLRHWTLSGILCPIGEVHIGAGKSRKYDEMEVFWAALALELSRWRIPVGVSDRIMFVARIEYKLRCDSEGISDKVDYVHEATKGRENIFMWIEMNNNIALPSLVIKIDALENVNQFNLYRDHTINTSSFLVINLSALFAKVRS